MTVPHANTIILISNKTLGKIYSSTKELSRGLYATYAFCPEHHRSRNAVVQLSNDGAIFVRKFYRACKPMCCEIPFCRDTLQSTKKGG